MTQTENIQAVVHVKKNEADQKRTGAHQEA